MPIDAIYVGQEPKSRNITRKMMIYSLYLLLLTQNQHIDHNFLKSYFDIFLKHILILQ